MGEISENEPGESFIHRISICDKHCINVNLLQFRNLRNGFGYFHLRREQRIFISHFFKYFCITVKVGYKKEKIQINPGTVHIRFSPQFLTKLSIDKTIASFFGYSK
jgi:hypothetical protein